MDTSLLTEAATLRRFAHRQVQTLANGPHTDLKRLLQHARDVYVDPDAYDVFYRGLRALFPDDYALGTVGAALVGCSSTRLQEVAPCIGCDPLCAAALPLPAETSDQQNSHCPSTVVLASHGKTGYDISVLAEGIDETVLVYIDSTTFTGFDARELDIITALGRWLIVRIRRGQTGFREAFNGEMVAAPVRAEVNHFAPVFLLAILLFIAVALVALTLQATRADPGEGIATALRHAPARLRRAMFSDWLAIFGRSTLR